ncbi:MAG: hypothetical protein CMJ48_07255 [Planctomycetaceae bacterium]|nr:hypothetical protein [Planctomycetaceae bacterium]
MSKSKPKRFTRKVVCPHCEKTFTVRYARAGEEPDDSEGTGKVADDCPHCGGTVMITLPPEYIPEETTLRGEPG